MRRIVIFSGTTEGRVLSDALVTRGIPHIVCVATDYGEEVMASDAHREVRVGRMTRAEMETFLAAHASHVYDATHPYATEVSENIRAAAQAAAVPCVRVMRDGTDETGKQNTPNPEQRTSGANIVYRGSAGDCAEYLRHTSGNIFLTTGSKELKRFASDETLRERLVARILPGEESLRLSREAGLSGWQIIAAQGPFSTEFNRAILRDYDIAILVTKESGAAGGYTEKLEAAQCEGVEVVVIARPEETGRTIEDVLREIDRGNMCASGIDRGNMCASEINQDSEQASKQDEALDRVSGMDHGHGSEHVPCQIDLVGVGPGDPALLTGAARAAIDAAELLFGAKRVLAPYADARAVPGYRAEQILPVLLARRPRRAAILFSGDTGFYSGARTLLPRLAEGLDAAGIQHEIHVHPGISSVSYLAAKCSVPYSDAAICSLHGAGGDAAVMEDVMEQIRHHADTFILLSGIDDVRSLGDVLLRSGLDACEVVLAEHLSYPEERIRMLSPAECRRLNKAGLYLALVRKKPEMQGEPGAEELK